MKRKQILFTLLVFVLSIFLLTGCKTKTKSTVTTKDNTSQTQPTQSGSSTSQTTKGGSSSSTTGGGNQSSVTVTPTQTTPKPVELKEGWEHDSEHHWRVNVDETDTQHYEEAAHDAGEWVIVTPASCTLEGLKELRCTVCGYVLRTEAIEKTAHNFEVEYKYENEQLVKVSSCKDCDAEEKNNAEPNTPSEIPTLTEGGVYAVYGKVLRFETNKIVLADATGSNETEFVLYRTKNANQYTDLVVGDFVLATGKMSHYTNGTEDFYEFNEGTILVSKAHEVRIYIDTENVQVQGTTDKVNTHETIVFTLSSLDQSKKLGAVKVNGVTVTPESEGENAGKYVVLVTADVHITAELIDVCAEFKSGYTQLAGLEVGQVLITTKASDGKIYYLVPSESTSNPGSRLTTDPTTLNTANLWTVTKEGDVYFFSFVENGTTYYLNRNGNKANTKITAEKGSGWTYENGSLKQDGKYLGIYERDKDFRAYDNNEHANFISGTGKGFVFYSYSEGLVYNHTLDKTEAQAAKCAEAGHKAYWTCSVCGKHFSDEAAENEIADLTAWLAQGGEGYIAPLGHDLEGHVTYEWYEKEDHSWGCRVTMECQHEGCALPTTPQEMDISYHNTNKSTCYSEGLDTYYACYVLEHVEGGEDITLNAPNKEIVVAKTAHNYVFVGYTKREGKWYADYECTNVGCTSEAEGHTKSEEVTEEGIVNFAIGNVGFTTIQEAIDSSEVGSITTVGDTVITDDIYGRCRIDTYSRNITLLNVKAEIAFGCSLHGEERITIEGDASELTLSLGSCDINWLKTSFIEAVGKEIIVDTTNGTKVTFQLAGIATIYKQDKTHANYQTLEDAIAAFNPETDVEILLNDDLRVVNGSDELIELVVANVATINMCGHQLWVYDIDVQNVNNNGTVLTIYNGIVYATDSNKFINSKSSGLTSFNENNGYHDKYDYYTVQDHTGLNIHPCEAEKIAGYPATCDHEGRLDYYVCKYGYSHGFETTMYVYETLQYGLGYIYYSANDLIIPALGHDWGEVTYNWDGNKCTATRVCKRDSSHVETETVEGVYVKDIDATCTANEKGHYVATFTNVAFQEQTSEQFEKTDSALGHDYVLDHIAFDEGDNVFTAKAYYVCSHDENHRDVRELEESEITSVTVDPTFYADGKITYTATRDGKSATKVQVLPKTELHTTEDAINNFENKEVTIIGIYKHTSDGGYVFLQSADDFYDEFELYKPSNASIIPEGDLTGYIFIAKGTVKYYSRGGIYEFDEGCTIIAILACEKEVKATCETSGIKAYYKYNDLHFVASSTLELSIIDDIDTWKAEGGDGYLAPLGHAWEFSRLEFDPNPTSTEAYAIYQCANDNDHHKQDKDGVTVELTNTVLPTCTEDGYYEYTASKIVHGNNITITRKIVIPALGHDYKAEFLWAEDICEVTIKCSRCGEKFVEELILNEENITFEVTAEYTRYTATYTYNEQVFTGSIDYYTVKFVDTDNTTALKTINWLVDNDSVVFDGTNPTKANDVENHKYYVFKGWALTANASEALESVPAATANATYYPVFEEKDIMYSITYRSIEGMDIIENTEAAYGTKVEFTVTLSKGYRFGDQFKVWLNLDDELEAKDIDTHTYEFTVIGDMALDFEGIDLAGVAIYYRDEANVGFSGTHEANYPQAHIYGEDTVLDTPTKVGYTFAGYFTTADCDGEPITKIDSTVSVETIVYAKWTINKYNVTFVDADGTTVLKSAKEYEYGTVAADIELPENPTKAATAQYTYTFAGWSPVVADVTEEVTYVATYNETLRSYLVYFYDIEGNDLPASNIYDYGTLGKDIVLPPVQEKAATAQYTYEFLGWNTNKDATVALEQLPTVEGELEFYPIFSATVRKYTVTFMAEGGNEIISQAQYPYGTAAADVVLPDPAPTKASTTQYDYVLDDWNVQEVTGNAIYTATFHGVGKIYTVSFDKNNANATGEMNDITVKYGNEAKNLPANAFINDGYRFQGWALTADGVVEYANNALISNLEKETTLYAKWAREYEIQIDLNNNPITNAPMGTVTVADNKTFVIVGEQITLTFTPAEAHATGNVIKLDSFQIGNQAQDVKDVDKDGKFTFEVSDELITNGEIVITAEFNEYSQSGEETTITYTFTNKDFADSTNSWKAVESGAAFESSNLSRGVSKSSGGTFKTETKESVNNVTSVTIVCSSNGSSTFKITVGSTSYTQTVTSNNVSVTKTFENVSGIVSIEVTTATKSSYLKSVTINTGKQLDKIEYYTVTLNKPENGSIEGIDFGSESSVTRIIDTASATYTFTPAAGYKLSSVKLGEDAVEFENNAVTFTGLSSENTNVISATFTPATYVVSFNKNNNEATGSMEDMSVTYGEDAKALTSNGFSLTGYSFAGWALTADGEKAYDNEEEVSNLVENIELYAIWEANIITISFEKGDENAEGIMAGDTFAYNAVKALPLNTYTNEGKTFIGWALVSDPTTVVFSDGQTINGYELGESGIVSLIAVWDDANKYHALTLETNEGTLEDWTVSQYKEGEEMSLPTPTRQGYHFLGWYTINGGSDIYANWGTQVTSVGVEGQTSDITLYAKWARLYYLWYNKNTSDEVTNMPADQFMIEGATYNASNLVPVRTGYTFVCWNTETSGLGTSYNPSDELTLAASENISLKAIWSVQSFSVTFASNNTDYGTITSDAELTISIPFGTAFTVSSNSITVNGKTYTASSAAQSDQYTYSFSEWSIANDYTMPAQDITVTATFARTGRSYNVIFHANDNSAEGTMANLAVVYGEAAKALTANGFTLSGHKFVKWNTQEDGNGTDYAADATVSNLEADLDLFAVWEVTVEEQTYSYTFDNNCSFTGISDTKTLEGVSWTISGTSNAYFAKEASGLHLGSGSKGVSSAKLSTSGITGKIKSIVINCKSSGTSGSNVVVKVGGVEMESSKNLSSSFSDYTFESTDGMEGTIEIEWDVKGSGKNLYIASITIIYE